MLNYNDFLYAAVELQRYALVPLRITTQLHKKVHGHELNPFSHTRPVKAVLAAYELFDRITHHYQKPAFGIHEVTVNNKPVKILEQKVQEKTFCTLLHFKKATPIKQEKLLIIAPLSGHYATLLRGTVEGLLPHFDVYITDWKNVRDIPYSKGDFGFDDYLDYCIEFMEKLGADLNVMAVCQPSVPLFSAACIMSAEKNKYRPKSVILMGGPIDTRINPTGINDFTAERTIQWFEKNVITRVSYNYPGFMRQVYPGFIQLSGFMAMNMHTHVGEHIKLFYHLIEGDGDGIDKHKKFYDEYLSVMDLPAKFYLETVRRVFKDHLLPRGLLLSHGRKVDPKAIRDIPILCIEGEKDDISGTGQTKAALDLCTNLPASMKQYHLQLNVGHYGIFNGKRYREEVVPVIQKFIEKCKKGR